MDCMETSPPAFYNFFKGEPNVHTTHYTTSSMAGFESQE